MPVLGRDQRGLVFDAVLSLVLLAASLLDWMTGALGGTYPHPRWVHLPFLVLTSLPLAARRRRPLPALVVFAIGQGVWLSLLYPLSQQPPLVPFVQLLVIVYSAAAYADGRAARAAWFVVALGVLVDMVSLLGGKPIGNVAGPDVSLLVAFSLGLGFARSRRQLDAARRRAGRLEADRLIAEERAAADERARIARELHDVISHDVSMIVLQASVEGRALGDAASGTTRQTLADIESMGREALAELRRMLGVLRHDEGQAPLLPQPGLTQLPAVVAHARASGLQIQLVVEGTPTPLPAGLDVAAYRVVQEAVTNVAKHAGAGTLTTVRVRYAGSAVEIEVVDEGPSNPQQPVVLPSGGHGLVGLRERVTLYGGTFEAGHRPGGGYRVHARVPVPS
jgi:signal transduction histidine kinase